MRRPMARMSKKPRPISLSPISTQNFLLAPPSSAPSSGIHTCARGAVHFIPVDPERARITIHQPRV